MGESVRYSRRWTAEKLEDEGRDCALRDKLLSSERHGYERVVLACKAYEQAESLEDGDRTCGYQHEQPSWQCLPLKWTELMPWPKPMYGGLAPRRRAPAEVEGTFLPFGPLSLPFGSEWILPTSELSSNHDQQGAQRQTRIAEHNGLLLHARVYTIALLSGDTLHRSEAHQDCRLPRLTPHLPINLHPRPSPSPAHPDPRDTSELSVLTFRPLIGRASAVP